MNTPNKETLKYLNQFCIKFISNLKGELIANDKISTQGLVNSLEYTMSDGIERIKINFVFAPHGKWIISGQRPHWTPIQPLINWARGKNQTKSFAYAVQRSIAKKGVKPFPFVQNIMSAMNFETALINGLQPYVKIDIENKINELLKEFMSNKQAA